MLARGKEGAPACGHCEICDAIFGNFPRCFSRRALAHCSQALPPAAGGRWRGHGGRGGTTARAILLVCLAGLLFVTMNSLVKGLTPLRPGDADLGALLLPRPADPYAVSPPLPEPAPRTSLVRVQLGRSVLLLLATVLNFLALFWLPLGEVAAITFTSPIIVAALAVPVLGERVGRARWRAILCGFAGALLIIQPGAETMNTGALLAFGCAVAYALYQISTRIVREAEPMVSLLYGGLVGMVATSLLVPFCGRRQRPWNGCSWPRSACSAPPATC